MGRWHALYMFLAIFTNTQITPCYGKGSLTYVIDTTPSMTAEINQVKASTDSITRIVLAEKSSQIQNMVLVTFSDPFATLKIVTQDRNTFMWYINQVHIETILLPIGYSCPETSMNGALLGLQQSLQGSFIYVFTDASARDYYRSNEVVAMCQEKKSQVVFILTGDCQDYAQPQFQVYYDIAKACSGLALFIKEHEVFSIFEPIKDAIKDKKEVIASRTVPAYVTMDIPFEIGDEIEYATVTASGVDVILQIKPPQNSTVVTTTMTWLSNVKMLRLDRPTVGIYVATVRSSSLTIINIYGKSDFSFEYGFSGLEAKTLGDTLPQPIANTATRLFLSVTDPKNLINITSAFILDMNENVIASFDLPLERISGNYYKSPSFIAPSFMFRLAVFGKAITTGKDIRRLAKFPIVPVPAATRGTPPTITGKTLEKVKMGTSVNITCTVTSGVPEANITWEFRANGNAKFVPIGDFNNVLHIPTAGIDDAGLYKCIASNIAGISEHITNLEVEYMPYVKPNHPKTYDALDGDASLNISCGSVGVPVPTILWSFKGKPITPGPHYVISGDTLTIKNPKMIESGSYKCEAKNYLGSIHGDIEVNIKGVPYITSKDSKTYEGIEGDVALRIPCEVVGVPPPTISWSVNGKPITTDSHFSIIGNELVIKNIKISDSRSYRCQATNDLGSTYAVFNTSVKEYPDDFGDVEIIKINILENPTYKLACGLPGQSVRWFVEKTNINVKGNYLTLNNLDDAFNGNYTCRVSDMQNSYTKTYRLVIGSPPTFQFEFETSQLIFDWNGNDNDALDCSVESTYNVKVDWVYNGEMLNDHKSLRLPVESKWGNYTCNVSNDFGSIQRTFQVVSSHCLLPKDEKKYGIMPIILNERFTWVSSENIANYYRLKHGEKITFHCPNYNNNINYLRNFAKSNEVTALCDKQDTFTVNGQSYKPSDFGCVQNLTPIVKVENNKCGKGNTKSMVVGYNVPSFLKTYEVCFDTLKNTPQYILEVMPQDYQSHDVHYNWYKHPSIDFPTKESVYTCKSSTSKCCYSKSQLVSAQDFSEGPAQYTTFIDIINAIPVWQHCDKNEPSWKYIGEAIRMQLDFMPASAIWSGTHKFQKINGHLVPRYLFKLVEYIDDSPIALVYINGPSPTKADILCKNICDDVYWLYDMGDHVYCCGEDFREAFNFYESKT